MSKLSLEENTITGAKSKICSCGRIITKTEDIAKGICRICNPFSQPENLIPHYQPDWREAQRIDDHILSINHRE